MKVSVFCGGSYVSGMEIMTLNLIDGLRRRGHDVRVLSSGWNDGDFEERLDKRRIEFDTAYLGKLTRRVGWRYLWWSINTVARWPGALLAVRRHLANFGPDVVLLFNRDAALLVAPVLRHRPCVFHVAEFPSDRGARVGPYRIIDRWVKGWIAVSHHVGDALQDSGIARRKISIVYNGIPSSVVGKRTPEQGAIRLGICGQIGAWKGHDDLIDALSLLKHRGYDVRALIFGKGDPSYIDDLKRKARAATVESLLEWRGFVRDFPGMYAALDIVAVPSRVKEAFGLVAAEAGLNGIPVVATRRGGSRKLLLTERPGSLWMPKLPSNWRTGSRSWLSRATCGRLSAWQHGRGCLESSLWRPWWRGTSEFSRRSWRHDLPGPRRECGAGAGKRGSGAREPPGPRPSQGRHRQSSSFGRWCHLGGQVCTRPGAEVEGKAFIAMEYVEGQTLQQRLKKGPLRLNQLLGLGVEIAEAVDTAHQKQIVHRDLKTANIMVTPEGHIKVLDFGVAKHLLMDVRSESDASTFSGRLTSADTTPGTVIYMSPEQVRGEPIDARTDLFSLGVVLYEMATGSVPFQGATSGMTYDLILNRGPVPVRGLNPDVPDELEHIIVKALEKDRDHRYQSARDLVVDLKRLKRDSSTSMSPVSGSRAPVTTSPKKKNVWSIAAAVGAAVMFALGILLFAPVVDAPGDSIDSLAVLPFENVHNDPDIDYLADGIAETLINRLSQLPQLEVMARSTAFRYRGPDIDP